MVGGRGDAFGRAPRDKNAHSGVQRDDKGEAESVEIIQAVESSQRKTASKNSQEGCSVLYYELLDGFQLALGLHPPPSATLKTCSLFRETQTHTLVPQAHVDTERLARVSTASLVGPRPNAFCSDT